MKQLSLTLLACLASLFFMNTEMLAKSKYDLYKPFGFATRSSRTLSTSTYNITGGGTFVPTTGTGVKVLTSTGKDMATTIQNAIKSYSVVILDGSNGDFIFSTKVGFSSLKNKTILGINGARLCTQWYVTDEIKKKLTAAGVPSMSTSSGGGTLPNGTSVTEQAEYNTRRIIIEMTGDNSEAYRNAGIFSFSNCENIVIRNIEFYGPGSIDVGGSDLISFTKSKHMWVDHCAFYDGMDGNFDITQSSDFITVSWCSFRYTDHSFMHQNTNLIGSSDNEARGYLNITFAFNNWGTGCRARMPMGRVGKIHMLNNYYNCKGNATACINPRVDSEFLIEGNYIDPAVTTFFSQSSAKAWVWADSNISNYKPSSSGTVTVPYTYSVVDAKEIPGEVGTYVGATLTFTKEEQEQEVIDPSADDKPGDKDDDDPTEQEEKDIKLPANTFTVNSTIKPFNGMKVIGTDITMTLGNDNTWNCLEDILEGSSYLGRYRLCGDTNPKCDGSNYSTSAKKAPNSGIYYAFTPKTAGTLSVDCFIYAGKTFIATENGTAISVTAAGKTVSTPGTVSSSNYYGLTTFSVKANTTYYVFCNSSKMGLYGFTFRKTGEAARTLGDVNGDNTIDTRDAIAIRDYWLGLSPTPFYPSAADVNTDNKITIADANKLLVK